MRWPFVWRDRYDALLRQDEQNAAALTTEQDTAERLRGQLQELRTAFENRTTEKTALQVANETLRGYIATRDEINGQLQAQVAQLEAEVEKANAKIDALKLEIPKPVKRKKSRLTEVIREQATLADGTLNPGLVRLFRQRAAQLKRQGHAKNDIIEAIENGWNVTTGMDSPPAVEAIIGAMSDPNLKG